MDSQTFIYFECRKTSDSYRFANFFTGISIAVKLFIKQLVQLEFFFEKIEKKS